MVRGVIRTSTDKHLIDSAIKYVTSLLVTFRCEER